MCVLPGQINRAILGVHWYQIVQVFGNGLGYATCSNIGMILMISGRFWKIVPLAGLLEKQSTEIAGSMAFQLLKSHKAKDMTWS